MSKRDRITEKAIEILGRAEFKQGIRWAALVRKAAEETGENINTCSGSLWNLPNEQPDTVSRPRKGLFILKDNLSSLEEVPKRSTVPSAAIASGESDIY